MEISCWEISWRLLLAVVLGGIVGWERERDNHPAGFRTHILVSLGSALITLISIYGFAEFANHPDVRYDPSRICAQIISGIGFLGAGTIFRHGSSVSGLTTAASLWVVAGVGLASGAGFVFGAGLATLLALVSLEFLDRLEGIDFKSRRSQVLRVTISGEISKLKEISDLIIQHGGIILRIKVDESDIESNKVMLSFTIKMKKYANSANLYEKIAQISGLHKLKIR